MAFRTELTPDQFQTLGTLAGPTRGALSPLPAADASGSARLTNPDLADPSGKPHPSVQPALEALFRPAMAVGLTVIGERGLTDAVVYHARHGDARVSLAHNGETLWLQDPAPVRELAAVVASQLRETPPSDPAFEAVFTPEEGAVFWATIDILRAHTGEAKAVSILMLREMLDRPFQGLELLGAYYRDCLHLPLPGESQLQSACETLARKGWLLARGGSFLPGKDLVRLARDFSPIRLHLLTQGNAESGTGGILSYRAWFLQGDSGSGLMWYTADEGVCIISRTRDQIIAGVGELLQNPGRLFAS